MNVLFNRLNGIYDVVNSETIKLDDQFIVGHTADNAPIIATVTEIIEQRPGKGNYPDETKRPMWARCKLY